MQMELGGGSHRGGSLPWLSQDRIPSWVFKFGKQFRKETQIYTFLCIKVTLNREIFCPCFSAFNRDRCLKAELPSLAFSF